MTRMLLPKPPNHPCQQINDYTMNDLIKNPFVAFIAGLLALWLLYFLLKLTINFFWVFVLAFVLLYFINDRFRRSVRLFLNSIFNKN